jgi:hypothetical protein
MQVHKSELEIGGPYYRVNMESIISALQSKIVHNIAVERYGVAAGKDSFVSTSTIQALSFLRFLVWIGRIVEVLMNRNNLDHQTISDMIIVPAKETRERLYRLHKYDTFNLLASVMFYGYRMQRRMDRLQ